MHMPLENGTVKQVFKRILKQRIYAIEFNCHTDPGANTEGQFNCPKTPTKITSSLLSWYLFVALDTSSYRFPFQKGELWDIFNEFR